MHPLWLWGIALICLVNAFLWLQTSCLGRKKYSHHWPVVFSYKYTEGQLCFSYLCVSTSFHISFFIMTQLITSWVDSSRLPPQKKEGPGRWQLEGQEPDGPSHPINVVWGEIKDQGIMCHVPVMGQTDIGETVGVIEGKCWLKPKIGCESPEALWYDIITILMCQYHITAMLKILQHVEV